MTTALKFLFFLVFVLFVSAHKHHECIHDQIPVNLTFTKDVDRSEIYHDDGRRLQSVSYQPIRIYADYTSKRIWWSIVLTFLDLVDGDESIREYIQNQLVPSAISYYQSTLRVIQTQNVLTLDGQPQCGGLTIPSYLINDGVAADLVFLITSGTQTDANYVAFSSPCALSSVNNRPTLGMLSFNLARIDTTNTPDLEQNLSTVLHEMMHVLGLSSNLYQFYIDPNTGLPLPNPVGYILL